MSHIPSFETHRVCFILEPFAGRDEARRRENDLVFDEIIEPAVAGRGFRIVRSSNLCRAGYIDREHQRLAGEESLVIANLSHADPVVHFSLAWRLALRKSTDRDLPVLALLRQGEEKLIESPVFTNAPVTYDLTPDRASTDVNYTHEEQMESMRRKLQLARNDLINLMQQLMDRDRDAASLPAPAQANGAAPNGYDTAAQPAPEPAMVVDEIVRQLMARLDGERNRDIVDRLSSTLLRT